MTAANSDLHLTIDRRDDGPTRVSLNDGDRSISRLWIIPFTLQIGAARVRMDGIGGVGTDEEYRKQGLSRRVLEAAVQWMREGDGALSMLYGIPDYYPKFGYAGAGPEHYLYLDDLHRHADLPEGWSVRSFEPTDFRDIQALYTGYTLGSVGTAVRGSDSGSWKRLTAPPDREAEECRLVIDPAGSIAAYVMRAQSHWAVKQVEKANPDALVLGEVVARGANAADAALAVCRRWAREAGAGSETPPRRVVLAQPPEGPIAEAAMRQTARLVQSYQPAANSMARVLDVERLLTALRPELTMRLAAERWSENARLVIRTEIGAATLSLTADGVEVTPMAETDEHVLELPQSDLACLALGAFSPWDVLDRLPEPPALFIQNLVEMLFPRRNPHMHLPDRY